MSSCAPRFNFATNQYETLLSESFGPEERHKLLHDRLWLCTASRQVWQNPQDSGDVHEEGTVTDVTYTPKSRANNKVCSNVHVYVALSRFGPKFLVNQCPYRDRHREQTGRHKRQLNVHRMQTELKHQQRNPDAIYCWYTCKQELGQDIQLASAFLHVFSPSSLAWLYIQLNRVLLQAQLPSCIDHRQVTASVMHLQQWT